MAKKEQKVEEIVEPKVETKEETKSKETPVEEKPTGDKIKVKKPTMKKKDNCNEPIKVNVTKAEEKKEAVKEEPGVKQLFPCMRTPFQLAKSIVDRSTVAVTYRMKHLVGQSNEPKMIAKARGQMAMGTMLFSTAFIFEKMGILQSATNKVDDVEKVREKF